MELINHTHGVDKIAKQCDTISHEILTSIWFSVRPLMSFSQCKS